MVVRYATFAALMTLGSMTGCGRDKPAAAGTAAAPQGATAVATPGGPPMCQRTGHWSECTVRIRLEQSGLAPLPGSDKVGDLPTFPMKPVLLTLGNAGVAIYLFADTLARHGAAVTLDTTKFIPQVRPVGIRSETTVIQNDNVLVLLFSKNEHQRERVADAITAGPPQP